MLKSKIKNTVINLLWPPRCMMCGRMLDVISKLSETNCVCDKCRPKYESAFAELCGECNQSVSRCLCGVKRGRGELYPIAKAFYYKANSENAAQNRIIFSLKHTDDKRIASTLAEALAPSVVNMLRSEGVESGDCIFTFVPRRRAAISRDGFDQGERIARFVAGELGASGNFKPLFRRVGGREQKRLDKNERHKNLESAIRLKASAERKTSGKYVVVIDDVITSGATMRAAEKLLLSVGVKKVLFACVARSKGTKNQP